MYCNVFVEIRPYILLFRTSKVTGYNEGFILVVSLVVSENLIQFRESSVWACLRWNIRATKKDEVKIWRDRIGVTLSSAAPG